MSEVSNAGWKIGEIPAITDYGRIPIAGWVHGFFGLDFRVWSSETDEDFRKGWCLTHLPTGRIAMGIFTPLDRAQELADELSSLGDWSFSEDEDNRSLAAIARSFRDKHRHVVSFRSAHYSPFWAVETQPAGDPA